MALILLFKINFNFNPRSREGSDGAEHDMIVTAMQFQSTLPRGERLAESSVVSTRLAFQSTLPRGERLAESSVVSTRLAFQSTLPRGERPFTNEATFSAFVISIHAPARGATAMI